MKNLTLLIIAIVLGFIGNSQCNSASIFANDSTNAVCFDTTINVRKCYSNNIPDHIYGPFGGGNTIMGQDFEYSMCLYPEKGTVTTPLTEDPSTPSCSNGIIFGVSKQGVNYSPFARLYFTNPVTLQENKNFIIEADFTLNMDINGGHVNAASRYHYHNIPLNYFTNGLSINSSSHSPIVGYAADGFPIYYKYLYTNPSSTSNGISAFQSSYSLKTGTRPGDSITSPSGNYDGTYVQDYEYISSLSNLDECGGRFAITPEYPMGTYYYVLTDNWPYIPRCLKGKYVDNSFRLGFSCPSSTASVDCSTSPTSVVEIAKVYSEITIYPNPSKDFLRIYFHKNLTVSEKVTQVRIYDSKATIFYSSNTFEEYIDVSSFKKGIYFIQINFKNEQITKKITIQ